MYFGIACKNWIKRSKFDNSNWLFGGRIVKRGNSFGRVAIRNLRYPGTAYKGDKQAVNFGEILNSNGRLLINEYDRFGPLNRCFVNFCLMIGKPPYDIPVKIWNDAAHSVRDGYFSTFTRQLIKSAKNFNLNFEMLKVLEELDYKKLNGN